MSGLDGVLEYIVRHRCHELHSWAVAVGGSEHGREGELRVEIRRGMGSHGTIILGAWTTQARGRNGCCALSADPVRP